MCWSLFTPHFWVKRDSCHPASGSPDHLQAACERIFFSHLPLSSRRKHVPQVKLLRDAPKRQRAHHQLTHVHMEQDRAQVGSSRRGTCTQHPGEWWERLYIPAGRETRCEGQGHREPVRVGHPYSLQMATHLQRWPREQLRSNTQVSYSSISVGSFPVPQHRNHKQDETTSSQLLVPRVFHCSWHQRDKQGRAAGTPREWM